MRKPSPDSRLENGGMVEDLPGTGALCVDAQADGVPCFEKGKDCETCKSARPGWRKRKNGKG